MSCKDCEDPLGHIECGSCESNMTEQIKQYWFNEINNDLLEIISSQQSNKILMILQKKWFGLNGKFEIK